MRRFTVPALLGAVLAFLAVPAGAADLKATVPFDFHLGNAVLPAGTYSIQVQVSNGLVMFRNSAGKGGAMSITSPADRPPSEKTGVLVFTKLGNDYFLNGVWAPDAQTGGKLPVSRHEKEAYARAIGTTLARVPATTK